MLLLLLLLLLPLRLLLLLLLILVLLPMLLPEHLAILVHNKRTHTAAILVLIKLDCDSGWMVMGTA